MGSAILIRRFIIRQNVYFDKAKNMGFYLYTYEKSFLQKKWMYEHIGANNSYLFGIFSYHTLVFTMN